VPRRRQRKATPAVVRDIQARRRAGESDRQIAADLGLSVRHLQRAAGFRRDALREPDPAPTPSPAPGAGHEPGRAATSGDPPPPRDPPRLTGHDRHAAGIFLRDGRRPAGLGEVDDLGRVLVSSFTADVAPPGAIGHGLEGIRQHYAQMDDEAILAAAEAEGFDAVQFRGEDGRLYRLERE